MLSLPQLRLYREKKAVHNLELNVIAEKSARKLAVDKGFPDFQQMNVYLFEKISTNLC